MQNGTLIPFHVAPASGVPLYRQLMDQVRFQVASGRLAPGAKLPSVREVAAALAVNPMTVSKAYSLLERDGVLERMRGQGMQVREVEAAGRVRERQRALRPLLEQVVARAHQLALTPEQVLDALSPLLKELEHG